MKVNEFKIISAMIYFSISMSIVFILLDYSLLESLVKAFIFPIYLYVYLKSGDEKNNYFICFLLGFSLTGIHAVINELDSGNYSCVGSIPIALAYLCLLFFFFEKLRFRHLMRHFGVYLVVLFIFNVYSIYALNQMMMVDELLKESFWEFLFECGYNVFMVLALSLSLLNYLYNDTRQNLLLFLAIACIVFSEMVQVVYIFSNVEVLKAPYLLLLNIGIYFIYQYILSKANHNDVTLRS